MTDTAPPARVHLFQYGEGFDDLRAAFHIDERAYEDLAQAQADVFAAEAALEQTGIIYEVETSSATDSPSMHGIPTWEEFKQRHFVEGVPLPVRPLPTVRAVPPSWEAMNAELTRACEALQGELIDLTTRAIPDSDVSLLENYGPMRQGRASVHLHEERFGFVVGVEADIDDTDPTEAADALSAVFASAGWHVDPPVVDQSRISLDGEKSSFLLWVSAEPGLVNVYGYSPLYSAPAEPDSSWRVEPRPLET